MNTYIGNSSDSDIRQRATSGGVGSSLIKYLFEQNVIGTSISFVFNKSTLQYTPKLIYSFDEYQMCGSIYQEIDLVNYIRENVDKVKGGFACFSLPCQTKAIRSVITKAGHECVIIGLTCSSQQTIEATNYLLKRLNIKKELVEHIQYRGNGWPSGVQIQLNDGTSKFVPNSGSIWNQIFHSRLFIRKKCFKCKLTLNPDSDITLADPWLPEYVKTEKIGRTLVIANTERGQSLMMEAKSVGYIEAKQFDRELIIKSQESTILRKEGYLKNGKLTEHFYNTINNSVVRNIVLSNHFFNYYLKVKDKFERIIRN